MSNLFIIPIEPIETRYSAHWFKYLPEFIREATQFDSVIQVEVDMIAPENTSGGFFNFNFTNAYKSAQLIELSRMITDGKVKSGDVFFYTDYWNPSVHMLKYMLDLNDLRCKIVGFAHAGDWDPADILHQKLRDKAWSTDLEESLNSAYDEIYFSTEFAKELYQNNLWPSKRNHLKVTGFPMEYYDDILPCYWDDETLPPKEDIVVFPHRIADEKNYMLFKLLEKKLPQFQFVVAMEVCKNKKEYHDLLYRSKVAFSAALQETGGISMGIEAPRAGCLPIVPNRLSYEEIFADWKWSFPGDFANIVITDPDHNDVEYLARQIILAIDQWNIDDIRRQHDKNYRDFFTGTRLYESLNKLCTCYGA